MSVRRWLFTLFSPLEAAVFLFFLVCIAVARAYNFPLELQPLHSTQALAILLGMSVSCAVLFSLIGTIRLYLRERYGRKLSYGAAVQAFFADYPLKRMAWETLRTVFVFHVLTILHTNLHQRVPTLNPQLYDSQFMALDKIFGFGADPVKLLAQSSFLCSTPVATFLDVLYVSWYPVKIIAVGYLLMEADIKWVRRFAFAWGLMWIIHIAGVIAWPSMGPFYMDPRAYEHVMLPAARTIQKHVLDGYVAYIQHGEAAVSMYEGMSGFPSLHVGLVFLYAFYLRRRSRWAFWTMIIYSILIWFDSAFTAWHYVIDGLAGGVMAAFCYMLSLRLPGLRDVDYAAAPSQVAIPTSATIASGHS